MDENCSAPYSLLDSVRCMRIVFVLLLARQTAPDRDGEGLEKLDGGASLLHMLIRCVRFFWETAFLVVVLSVFAHELR